MPDERTSVVVQQLLDALGDAPAEAEIIRDLLARAVPRLKLLCSGLLRKSYPRLTKPPLCLHADELLSAVVERLLKALRQVRPSNVRQFFALAHQHLRWELNDLARRLDEQDPVLELPKGLAVTEKSDSGLTLEGRRIWDAIGNLPEEEREVFELVRIQGLPHREVAEILGISTKTVQRRLHRVLVLLAERLHDLAPE
jgi:RNA polymerase sigma factor (sigma-70 family)